MTKEKFWHSISAAIFDSDLVASRMTLSFAEFFWFVMLAWPGDTFGRPTYTAMSHVMSEEAWALIFLISSATQMMIVLQEDFHSRFARYFAAWNASLWIYVVGGMLVSVYPPPAAIGGEMALALAALWICVRPFILAIGYCRVRKSNPYI